MYFWLLTFSVYTSKEICKIYKVQNTIIKIANQHFNSLEHNINKQDCRFDQSGWANLLALLS